MKRLFRMFALSKSEQRLVLIMIIGLIGVALVGYEHRVHQPRIQPASTTEPKASPSPQETEDDR